VGPGVGSWLGKGTGIGVGGIVGCGEGEGIGMAEGFGVGTPVGSIEVVGDTVGAFRKLPWSLTVMIDCLLAAEPLWYPSLFSLEESSLLISVIDHEMASCCAFESAQAASPALGEHLTLLASPTIIRNFFDAPAPAALVKQTKVVAALRVPKADVSKGPQYGA